MVRAAPGVNAGILITLTGFPATTSGTYSNTFAITPTQVSHLQNGLCYFNIHNGTFPNGEIRGQLTLSSCPPISTPTPTPTASPSATPLTPTPTPASPTPTPTTPRQLQLPQRRLPRRPHRPQRLLQRRPHRPRHRLPRQPRLQHQVRLQGRRPLTSRLGCECRPARMLASAGSSSRAPLPNMCFSGPLDLR